MLGDFGLFHLFYVDHGTKSGWRVAVGHIVCEICIRIYEHALRVCACHHTYVVEFYIT